jgi:hypothetical protein
MNALTPEMLVRLDQAWAQISKDQAAEILLVGDRVRSPGQAFAAEDEAIKVVLRSADAREGSEAFMEKRPPHFTGA